MALDIILLGALLVIFHGIVCFKIGEWTANSASRRYFDEAMRLSGEVQRLQNKIEDLTGQHTPYNSIDKTDSSTSARGEKRYGNRINGRT